mmetsp:Transcript_7167/g.11402  ORF Transcript_7167/g.11402 Transcript_7167/m.11402 type:complete len:412 (+) Transcript_7167:799-2034(+)
MNIRPGLYHSVRVLFNAWTRPPEHADIDGKCSWAWRPTDIRFFLGAGAGKDDPEISHVYLVVNTDECNVFHQLWLFGTLFEYAIDSTLLLADQMRRVNLLIGLSECMKWIEPLLLGFPTRGLPLVIDIEFVEPGGWGDFFNRHGTKADTCFSLQHHGAFRFLRKHESWHSSDYTANRLLPGWIESVRKRFDVDSTGICERDRPVMLIIERNGLAPRRLTDPGTGQSAIDLVVDKIHALGFEVKRVSFDNMSAVEQMRHVATANVLLAPHGAALTNAIYLPRCTSGFKSTVMEVSVRFAYCQSHGHNYGVEYTHELMLEEFLNKCTNRFCHKADFFALTHIVGYLRYIEIVNYGMGFHMSKTDHNPIKTVKLLVKPELLLDEVTKLKRIPNYDYRMHETYNGLEGVQDYTIS